MSTTSRNCASKLKTYRQPVLKGRRAFQASQVFRVHRAFKALQVQLALRENRGRLVRRDLVGFKARMVKMVVPESKDQLAFKALRASKAR